MSAMLIFFRPQNTKASDERVWINAGMIQGAKKT
jgi:hypothetical protein